MFPRNGSDAEFARLRGALGALDYTEAAVCRRLGLERMSGFVVEGSTHQQEQPEDPLGVLIWLLMEGQSVTRAAAGNIPIAELEALGLLRPLPADAEQVCSTVLLHPLRDLLIVSDRTRPVPGDSSPPPADFVYPAIVATTERYLSMVRFEPCDAFLDLCSGTGIAGLVAARSGARHVWASDITERSTQFAEFNRRLNAISNFTPVCGDLYEPVGDLTFDCIAAHVPYVPVFRQNMIFDSGGQDGEQIVRGVIEGLPRYLRPGARLYAPLIGTDRDQFFEQRVRGWLGEAEDEFDVAFFIDLTLSPQAYTADAVTRNRATAADVKPWRELLDHLGVQAIQRGFLMVQRRASPRPVFTLRRDAGPRPSPPAQHWLMDFETARMEDPAAPLAQKPRAAASARLRVQHILQTGAWTAESLELQVEHPFEMRIAVQPWTAQLLARADGSRTGAELLETLKTEGVVQVDTPPLEFARVLAQLASGGFLELSGFRLPAAE